MNEYDIVSQNELVELAIYGEKYTLISHKESFSVNTPLVVVTRD